MSHNYLSGLSYSTDAMLSRTEKGPKTNSGPDPCSYFGAGAGFMFQFRSRNRTRILIREQEPYLCFTAIISKLSDRSLHKI